MESEGRPRNSSAMALAAICGLLVVYAASLFAGIPQRGTAAVIAHQKHATAEPAAELEHAEASQKPTPPPPLFMKLPFLLLLGAIAVFPLVGRIAHWWEHNLNKFLVAVGLAVVTLLYYVVFHEHEVAGHFPAHYLMSPVADGPNVGTAATVLSNAILAEFIPFIVLLFALYTITGGIRLEGDLTAH